MPKDPAWLSEKDTWVLSDTFVKFKNTCHPELGDELNGKKIVGIWVNHRGTLKAYKVQCLACDNVTEYFLSNNLKRRVYQKCKLCYNTKESTAWFRENYDAKSAHALEALYAKRYDCRTMQEDRKNRNFEPSWYSDYKDFAKYVSSLENFDKWPKYKLNRIDNEKGYLKGNLDFVTNRINTANYTGAKKIRFKDKVYFRPEFIQWAVGIENYRTVFNFIFTRVDKRGYKLATALYELFTYRDDYPDRETKARYDAWYKENFLSTETSNA